MSDADELFTLWLHRVRAGLIDTQEALRGAITEARAQHRIAEAQVLNEVLWKVEQDTQTLIVEPFHEAAREGAEAEAVPSHFSGRGMANE